MKEIDAGHDYMLDSFDGNCPQRLVFMKREGKGYPLNVGHHPGTNCQEVDRVLIARTQYLQQQIFSWWNVLAIFCRRVAILAFEKRAAKRHGRQFSIRLLFGEIERMPTCAGCGHIGCNGQHRAPKSEGVNQQRREER